MRWSLIPLVLALGCGGGEKPDDTDLATTTAPDLPDPPDPTSPPTTAPDPAATDECDDPGYNPWAGTCVETFLADCFDPEGECTGQTDAMGNVLLTWENGAYLETTTDFSNPSDPTITTVLYSSAGDLCAQGDTQVNVGGCASLTIYQRPDGATQRWCIYADGSTEVTCDDGSTIAVTAEEAERGDACSEYSDCTMSY